MKKAEENKVQCVCGCIVDRSELVQVKKVGKSGKPFKVFCCPKHQDPKIGTVKYRIYNCIECGKECKVSVRAALACRCPEHQRIYHNKMCNERNKARELVEDGSKKIKVTETPKSIAMRKKVQASKDRSDCKHRRNCIDKAIINNKNVLPCLGCNRYKPDFFGSDAMKCNGHGELSVHI